MIDGKVQDYTKTDGDYNLCYTFVFVFLITNSLLV